MRTPRPDRGDRRQRHVALVLLGLVVAAWLSRRPAPGGSATTVEQGLADARPAGLPRSQQAASVTQPWTDPDHADTAARPDVVPADVAAAVPTGRIDRRRRARRVFAQLAVAAVVLCAALGGIAATRAQLTDQATMAPVNVTGGVLHPPATGPVFGNVGTALRTAWTPPATGIAPQSYEIFRRLSSGSYPGSALATDNATPYDDATAVQCTPYHYKIRSRYGNMLSLFTPEAPRIHDYTAPTVTNAVYVGTSGPQPVTGWVKSSGQYYVYANVDDNCTSDESLNIVWWTGGYLTHGSYTVDGGTYNFRGGPYNAGNLAHGTVVDFYPIAAQDPTGNIGAAYPSGTFDNAAPVAVKTPQIVSELTNYFSPEYGRGEIKQGTKFGVYANWNDADSGMATATNSHGANLIALHLDASQVWMSAAATTLDNGETYTHRSTPGAWTAAAVLPEGPRNDNFMVAQDKLGNVLYTFVHVDVDNTALNITSCTTANGGTGNRVGPGDSLTVDYNDNIDPGSFVTSGWTGLANVSNVPARGNDAGGLGLSPDTIDINSATHRLFAGTGTNALELKNGGWFNSTVQYATSTLARATPSQLVLTLGGVTTGPTPLLPPGNVDYNPHTSVMDPAGNTLTAGVRSCPQNF